MSRFQIQKNLFTIILGPLIGIAFVFFLIRPEHGSCRDFTEQAKMLGASEIFDSFPATGSTKWTRFDRLRTAYRVFGRVESLEAYVDWRYGDGTSETLFPRGKRPSQKENIVIGNVGDEYFIDSFHNDTRYFYFYVLNDGQFYFDTGIRSGKENVTN